MGELSGKRFPIMIGNVARDYRGPRSVPWEMVEPHRETAQRFHGQTLEQLAKRGGLSWCEFATVVTGIRYNDAFGLNPSNH